MNRLMIRVTLALLFAAVAGVVFAQSQTVTTEPAITDTGHVVLLFQQGEGTLDPAEAQFWKVAGVALEGGGSKLLSLLELVGLPERFDSLEQRVSNLEERVSNLEKEVAALRTDVAEIKDMLQLLLDSGLVSWR